MVADPHTASAAYLQWIQCERYLEDDGPENMLYMADLTIRLAKAESVSLEVLIPDPGHLKDIQRHAEQFQIETSAWDYSDDDPPPVWGDEQY